MLDNLKNKKCIFKGCNKQPGYAKKGEKTAKYCYEHKESGMIDIKNKSSKCTEKNCNVQANFGIPGNKSTACTTHKTKGMIYNPNKKCTIDRTLNWQLSIPIFRLFTDLLTFDIWCIIFFIVSFILPSSVQYILIYINTSIYIK